MNQFKQVSSDSHQMSQAGEDTRCLGGMDILVQGCPMCGEGAMAGVGGGHCTLRSNASWVMVTWDSPNRITDNP